VFACVDDVATIVELGSGSGEKLRMLAEAESGSAGRLTIHLIDISGSALVASARALADLDGVAIVTHEAPYEAGLAALGAEPRANGAALVLFLGSNIGNFDRPGAEALVGSVRAALTRGDGLLVGADLVKPERELLLAYDDPLGITAAFNRNLLVRINRELSGDFDIGAFAHRAVWNEAESRVEMHLVARSAQRVRVTGADLELDIAAGEPIWTESSYKYRPEEIVELVERAGFQCAHQWIDSVDRFALTLFQVT
jgi:dimethylhistidine N-methyltransferase